MFIHFKTQNFIPLHRKRNKFWSMFQSHFVFAFTLTKIDLISIPQIGLKFSVFFFSEKILIIKKLFVDKTRYSFVAVL